MTHSDHSDSTFYGLERIPLYDFIDGAYWCAWCQKGVDDIVCPTCGREADIR